MSSYLRPRRTGARIFFTVSLQEQGSRLLCDEINRLRQAVAETRRERPFAIDAWVVLPDHMHCLWTLPAGDCDYSIRWGAIKSRFTRGLRRAGFHPTAPSRSKVAKGDAGIWQRRFWEHHIRNDADMTAHLRYCWFNPVKHGLVRQPEDWPFSSVHREIAAGRWEPQAREGVGWNPTLRMFGEPRPLSHPSSAH